MAAAELSQDAIAARLRPGVVVCERYQLSTMLGDGLHGSTWAAYLVDSEELVALKVIRLRTPPDDGVRRVQRFAETAAPSDGVLELREFRYDAEGGLFCLAYEYIDGWDLTKWSATKSPKSSLLIRDVDLLIGIVRGLGSALARGFHHHALKPTNVLVSRDGRVLLADFDLGIGGHRETEQSPYVDPFLAPGSDRDIYSVGVIAYQLLLGDFTRAPAESVPTEESKARCSSDPLFEVARRCMAAPRERYSDLAALLRDLERAKVAGSARTSPPRPRVDEDVQLSVYRPKALAPGVWHKLVAFVHLAEKRPDDPEGAPDPFEEVQRRAQAALRDEAVEYRGTTQDSMTGLPEGGTVTLALEGVGLEFNPPTRAFEWRESVHEETFRMRASPSLDGSTARARLLAFVGPILLAEVRLSFRVESTAHARTDDTKVDRARAYRKIFASYAHTDASVVARFDELARALGDRYLIDVRDLRAGEVWSNELERLIAEADIFQLFWSHQSMRSPFCRREWEYALALERSDFVRPVYWDQPMPRDERAGLPPEELSRLHFGRLGPALGPIAPAEPPLVVSESFFETGNEEVLFSEHAIPGPTSSRSPDGKPSFRESVLPVSKSSRRSRVLALTSAALVAAGAALAVLAIQARNDAADREVAALAERQRVEAELARARRELDAVKEKEQALRSALASAKDEIERARLEAELARAELRRDNLKSSIKAGAGKPRSEKACNCPPGDPLCSCL